MRLTARLVALRDDLRVRLSFRRIHGPARVTLPDNAFAVVTLMKNAEWFLPAFLEHHLAVGAAHIVIVDNGSTDRTVEIARAHPRVTVLHNPMPAKRHEVELRAQAARRVVRGGWVMFADADEMAEMPFGASADRLLSYCNAQGFTAVVGQMLDLYAPNPTPGADYRQAVAESTAYATGMLDRLAYHDTSQIGFHWFLKDNRCDDPGVRLLRGGLRREVFGEDPFLSKHTLVRNRPGIGLMTHPHCASGVNVADVTLCLRHYKLAGDWAARDRASVAATAWDHAEDVRRVAAVQQAGFAIAPADPKVWHGSAVLAAEGFLYASPRARAALATCAQPPAARTAASPLR